MTLEVVPSAFDPISHEAQWCATFVDLSLYFQCIVGWGLVLERFASWAGALDQAFPGF